jgi:hypothetical protein
MPIYDKLVGPWTVARNETIGFVVTFEFSDRGADHGPLFMMATPVSHANSRQVKLVTLDLAKGRRAPTATGETKVFYECRVRNESDAAVSFDMEFIDFQDLKREAKK